MSRYGTFGDIVIPPEGDDVVCIVRLWGNLSSTHILIRKEAVCDNTRLPEFGFHEEDESIEAMTAIMNVYNETFRAWKGKSPDREMRHVQAGRAAYTERMRRLKARK